MADISLDLGSITLGVDLPFIDVPRTSLGVGFDIPLTPAIAVGADLGIKAAPAAVVFELSVGVTLLRFLSIDYTIAQWSVSNPLTLPVPTVPPSFPSQPPQPSPQPDVGYTVFFPSAGTLVLFSNTDSTNFGFQRDRFVTLSIGAGVGFYYIPHPNPGAEQIGCIPGGVYLFGLTNGGYLGSHCRQGGNAFRGVFSQSISWWFIPADPREPYRFFEPLIPGGEMTCSCSQIEAIVNARFEIFQTAIVDALECIGEDVRSMRTAFYGVPQTATIGLSLIGTGLSQPLPGDLVLLEVTPVILPPGESQWLTDPKLYQVGVIVPIFADGKYGAPQTLIAPFGASLRIPVQLANIRRVYYSINPGVQLSAIATYQTAPNQPNAEWC